MESTTFWQILVIVTWFVVLSTALSAALCVYIFKMYPKLVASMMEAMDNDPSLDEHYLDTPEPGFFPPSLNRE